MERRDFDCAALGLRAKRLVERVLVLIGSINSLLLLRLEAALRVRAFDRRIKGLRRE